MAVEDDHPTGQRDYLANDQNDQHRPETSASSTNHICHEDSSTHGASRVPSLEEIEIDRACSQRDIALLQTLALRRGGFVSDQMRVHAWSILLGIPPWTTNEIKNDPMLDSEDFSWKDLPPHNEEEQVKLDVNRAFVYYPDYQTEAERTRQKEALSNLILSVLRRHPYLHYFQGFHDICQVFLLVLPPSLRYEAVARLSNLRIRDFMLPNLEAAIAQLRLIPSILHAADPLLWAHLSQTEPFFALSGTLTMYAHDVQSLGEITRLFDVLLAREPVFSVYMFARIVLSRRAELFDTPATEPEMLHSILSKLPQPLDLEALIADTAALFARHPPETLGRAWAREISAHSVLKTARDGRECAGQSTAVGEYHFSQQVLELQRAERRDRMVKMLWSYRRPAGTVGLAILFGVLAFWIRRSTATGTGGPLGYVAAVISKWFRYI